MINIFQPKIDIQTAINNYREVLESNWIGRGKVTKQFEDELASFLEIEKNNLHTVASCTDAIFNILRTLNFSINSGSLMTTAPPSPVVRSFIASKE